MHGQGNFTGHSVAQTVLRLCCAGKPGFLGQIVGGNQMIQSLERGIRTLLFMSIRRTAGVTEVAKELDVNKSTAYRILETLMSFNIVVQDLATAKYKLGPGILQISDQLVKGLNIISIAKP